MRLKALNALRFLAWMSTFALKKLLILFRPEKYPSRCIAVLVRLSVCDEVTQALKEDDPSFVGMGMVDGELPGAIGREFSLGEATFVLRSYLVRRFHTFGWTKNQQCCFVCLNMFEKTIFLGCFFSILIMWFLDIFLQFLRIQSLAGLW